MYKKLCNTFGKERRFCCIYFLIFGKYKQNLSVLGNNYSSNMLTKETDKKIQNVPVKYSLTNLGNSTNIVINCRNLIVRQQ